MIRLYTEEDFPTLESWCMASGISTMTPDQFPIGTTYIFEWQDIPMLSLSLLLPNAKEIAYLEYFVGNPELRGKERRKMARYLVQYAEDRARGFGYKKLVCLAPNQKLREYYATFGYSPNLEGLTLMVKEI